MLKVFISSDPLFTNEINYIWKTLAQNKSIVYDRVNEKLNADFIIDETEDSDLPISISFYLNLQKNNFKHESIFPSECVIRNKSGKPDYLSTCFYMINSLQEYNDKYPDELGRFKFSNSFQYKYNLVHTNLVQDYFDRICNETPKLHEWKNNKKQSGFFLTHDIDNIHGALKEDGYHCFKNLKFIDLARLAIHAVLQNPDWLNMDKILKIESEYDFKSAFYWMVNRGKINKREKNSDYNITDKRILKNIDLVLKNGSEIGIHKSISNEEFKTEIKKLPFPVKANRYHYLKFNLPNGYEEIEKSGLLFDSSLGFAETHGFRNGYGLPFHPYNLKEKKSYSFLEMPLHAMDRSFYQYLMIPPTEVYKYIEDFIEKNRNNSIFTILWHNYFFSELKYSDYLLTYKKLLKYFYDNNFKCYNQNELIKTFN